MSLNLTIIDESSNRTVLNGSVSGGGAGGGGAGRGGASYFIPWDNPENVMSKETSDNIVYVLECFVFPIITAFGSVGNILSLIVISDRKLRSSTTSIVLLGLALSDLLFLLSNMARKSTLIIQQFDELKAAEFNAKGFRYAFYLKTCFSRVSTLLIVVISAERFIAVAFPLKVKSLVTKRRMTLAVISCFVVTFAGLSLLPAQYTYVFFMGKMRITNTEFAKNNADSLKIYNERFLPLVFRYIPVLVVIVFNLGIIFIIYRQTDLQKTDGKRKDDQRRVTRMLCCVAGIYLLFLVPGDLILLYADIDEKFRFMGPYHNLFMALSDISLLFEMINSSVNFIIYMVLNRNFYNTYKTLFCRCAFIQSLREESVATGRSRLTADLTSQSKKTKQEKALQEYGFDSAIGSSSVVSEDPASKE